MAKSNKELIEYVSSHSAVVSKLFDKFIIELAKAGIPYDQLPDDKVFKLSDYPESAKNASRLADKMRKALKDELIKSIDGAISLAMDITSAEFKPYTRLKDDALKSFRDAVTATYTNTRINTSKGLSLSNRVWNYTEQTKSEFELAMSQILEDGLSKGTSAEEIGRKIRSKLRNPDMMYRRYHTKKIQSNGLKVDVVEWRRRVVDSEGNVHFVKEDLAKVGRGVYRSARQNALRMAATEVNMAYQYAENMRYQKEPFVLGYRINLSTNHTCKDKDGVPRPFHDMCDELEGDYPKWFLWRSWHPRCRCYMTAIRCSKEEMRKIAKLPQDEYERYVSPNAIHNMPDCYNQYIENNRDRIEASIERGTQPYWIQDNYVDGDINGGFVKKTAPEEIIPTPQEATPEQKAIDDDLMQYTEAQRENFEELEKRLKVSRGTSMTHEEANTGRENPKYNSGGQFTVNCQTCTVTHELRRRGFNITAKGRTEGWNSLGDKIHWMNRFQNEDGSRVKPEWIDEWKIWKGYKRISLKLLDKFFAEKLTEDGRYEIMCAWRRRGAHVFCVDVKEGKQLWFDPQTGKEGEAVLRYKKSMSATAIYVLRIDNKIINPAMTDAFNAQEGVVNIVKTKE